MESKIIYTDITRSGKKQVVQAGDVVIWERRNEFHNIPARIEGIFGDYDSLNLQTEFGNLMAWGKPFYQGQQQLFFVAHGEDEGKTYIETCVRFYEQLVEEGGAISAFNLGLWYSQGNFVKEDAEKGKKYLTIARERGHPLSPYFLAKLHISKQSAEFIELVRSSATWGFYMAQYDLGYNYQYGEAGLTQDYEQAVYWYKKSAEHNYAPAMCNLADKYEHGLGVDQDYLQAMAYYMKSAEQNTPEAMFSIANMYLDGKGVPVDTIVAKVWFEKAVKFGYAPAKQRLLDLSA